MKLQRWLKSEVDYGEDLVRSAIAGARSAREKTVAEEPVRQVLTRSARTSVPWALTGASLGVLVSIWGNRRKSVWSMAMLGLLGAIVGFGANMAAGTRPLTEPAVRSALKNINTARDAHWLSRHPIDYA